MCVSDRRNAQRGFGTADAVVGVALGLLAVATGLSLVRGAVRLSGAATGAGQAAAGAEWALTRIAREVARAGLGVCPGAAAGCPDEAVELLTTGALAVRGDLDRDDPARALVPERWLAGAFPRVETGNDEVTVYLLRSDGRMDLRALFDADLDSTDRTTLPDGTTVARRDGVVESIDAGPLVDGERVDGGTLYRVTFVHDARQAGTGRFRVVEPLLDGAARFTVEARDGAGDAVGPCGGADDSASRACRGAVRRVRLVVTTRDEQGREHRASREIALGGGRP